MSSGLYLRVLGHHVPYSGGLGTGVWCHMLRIVELKA